MLLPCLTAWAAWVAWAACTKPPRCPRFRLNKKGPASGGAFFCIWRLPGRWSGPATPWKQQGRLLPARPEGGRKHRLPLWAPFPTGLFCKGTRLRAMPPGGCPQMASSIPVPAWLPHAASFPCAEESKQSLDFSFPHVAGERIQKSGQPVTADRLRFLWCARRDSNSWPTGS